MISKTYPIILAGGRWTRLWPLSRTNYPKQFVKLEILGRKSTFQLALERALEFAPAENIRVSSRREYVFHAIQQASEIGIELDAGQICYGDVDRNSLDGLVIAMRKVPEDGTILMLTADHIIEPVSQFVNAFESALKHASQSIVLFGIVPTHPDTGFWYISPKIRAETSEVVEFLEKPDALKAAEFVRSGYLWNSGMLLASRKILEDSLITYDPRYREILVAPEAEFSAILQQTQNLTIDYAILEKGKHLLVVPLSLDWRDIGSFDAIEKYAKEKNSGDAGLYLSSSGSYGYSDSAGKIVALIGIEDAIAIDTKDALLVVKKWSSERVKELTGILQKEHPTMLEGYTTSYRPWGSYTILAEGPGYKVKSITVLPGKRLSLQYHHYRSEHWVVVDGTATVTLGDSVTTLHVGESAFVPIGMKHRLENTTDRPLSIIESAIWEKVDESDIVRVDDDFGREK